MSSISMERRRKPSPSLFLQSFSSRGGPGTSSRSRERKGRGCLASSRRVLSDDDSLGHSAEKSDQLIGWYGVRDLRTVLRSAPHDPNDDPAVIEHWRSRHAMGAVRVDLQQAG